MTGMLDLSALLAAIESKTTLADMAPYLIVMIAGFLTGWWGNTMKSWPAAAAGVLLVIAAIIGFVIEFPLCPDGATCSLK